MRFGYIIVGLVLGPTFMAPAFLLVDSMLPGDYLRRMEFVLTGLLVGLVCGPIFGHFVWMRKQRFTPDEGSHRAKYLAAWSLAPIIAAFVMGGISCGIYNPHQIPPSDGDLVAHFNADRADFDKLEKSIVVANKVDKNKAMDLVEGSSGLTKKLGVIYGHSSDFGFEFETSHGFYDRGYLYADKTPHNTLEESGARGYDQTDYKPLSGHWYTYWGYYPK